MARRTIFSEFVGIRSLDELPASRRPPRERRHHHRRPGQQRGPALPHRHRGAGSHYDAPAGPEAIDFHFDSLPLFDGPTTSAWPSPGPAGCCTTCGPGLPVRGDEPRPHAGVVAMPVHLAIVPGSGSSPRPAPAPRERRRRREPEEAIATASTWPRSWPRSTRRMRRRRAAGPAGPGGARAGRAFLEHSPVAGRGGGLGEALRMVDAAAFIDPVVPVDCQKSGGAAAKGAAQAEPVVHGLRHPPGQPVRRRRQPLPAHRRHPPERDGRPPRRPAGGPGPRGRGRLGHRRRRLVGARGGRGGAPADRPGGARRRRRRVAGPGPGGQGRRRLRRGPPAGPYRPGRARRQRPAGGADPRPPARRGAGRARGHRAHRGGRRHDPRRTAPAARPGGRPPGYRRCAGGPLALAGRLGRRCGPARGRPVARSPAARCRPGSTSSPSWASRPPSPRGRRRRTTW